MKSKNCKQCVAFKSDKCYLQPVPVDKLAADWCCQFEYATAWKTRKEQPGTFQPAELTEVDQ